MCRVPRYASKAPGAVEREAAEDWPQWEAAAATSAAPTIFPPVTRGADEKCAIIILLQHLSRGCWNEHWQEAAAALLVVCSAYWHSRL